jgi:hypothetical protein
MHGSSHLYCNDFLVNPLNKSLRINLILKLLNFKVANSITFKDYESISGSNEIFFIRRYFATICDLAGNLELSGIYLS